MLIPYKKQENIVLVSNKDAVVTNISAARA